MIIVIFLMCQNEIIFGVKEGGKVTVGVENGSGVFIGGWSLGWGRGVWMEGFRYEFKLKVV